VQLHLDHHTENRLLPRRAQHYHRISAGLRWFHLVQLVLGPLHVLVGRDRELQWLGQQLNHQRRLIPEQVHQHLM